MGAYEVGSDGVLTRRSLSQDDELRPLPGARALAGAG